MTNRTSHEVSYLGSILKLNSIGHYFNGHQLFKQPSVLAHLPKPPKIRTNIHQERIQDQRNTMDGVPPETPLTLGSPCAKSTGVTNGDASKETRHGDRCSPTPSRMMKDSAKSSTREKKRRERSTQSKPKKGVPIFSPICTTRSEVRDTPNIQEISCPSSPISVRSPSPCPCKYVPEEQETDTRPMRSTSLVSNIYYIQPPRSLVEYRHHEVSHPTLICCEKLTDELIDLTQSTINMVQSLKRELRD